ncbi:MAG: hypothetical protein E7595_04370 [Ruminococcaceae bacterium]|nr:hypothetical protein [Oscillospiraceae bacterium]
MLHRVMGPSGSGKTEYMLSELSAAVKKGRSCIVIVPEQQSVSYETLLCDRFGDSINLCCEVLNFERLPNRIAREYGGLAINNIDKGGACALLSLVAESLKDELSEYSSVAEDPDFASSLYSLISGMKMALITPELLENAIANDSISDDARLSSKLGDILKIYREYEKHFGFELHDPRDALTKLADELGDKPFFKNTAVFIDSYYTFTEQEYAIIKEIISQSNDVYISFTVDSSRSFFDENDKAAKRVRSLANNIYVDHVTPDYKRSAHRSLAYIENNLWKSNPEVSKLDDGAVRLISAKNRFDEVEAAASVINEYIRSGGRYRDITMLAGNIESYSAIVSSVFERAEIPVYMSSKESLATKPLFAFLLASISVVTEDFSVRSIKRYLKSGYTDLDVAEIDALLGYASSWNIRGKAWYNDTEWTMDPEGYREGDITERGARMLKAANQAREKIVPPLAALRDTLLKKNLTVSEALKALYLHIVSMDIPERLRENAESLLRKGEREDSERVIQLWKMLINIIDQLDSLCGDKIITAKRLLSLIRLMCDCYSLGAIPASADSVTFGDASLIRAGGSKMVIVLGVCDGEFPSSVQKGGFFDRDEAVLLEYVGLRLGETMEKQLNTNRFFVYAALSAPTEKLVLLRPRSEISGGELRASSAWLSVERMLDLEATEFQPLESPYSRESVAASYPILSDCELKNSIKTALENNNIGYFEDIPKISDAESRIEFSDDILLLSPSKFERYALCPFSFFGSYILNLQEKKENEFSMPEIGNFVHKILEQFMRECVKTGKFLRPTEDERKALIKRLADSYLEEVIGRSALEDKRFLHIFGNMVKTIDFVSKSLCNEFEESDFIPSGFEFKIGLKDQNIPAIEYDVDGKKVLLRGSIDRVDTYIRNGIKYVRVIDYKTYNKAFSADLVAHGLDSQLLHYLFAYCEKENAKPAGVLYYTVTLPNIQINGRETPEKITSMVEKSITRSGVLLDDPEIVLAMSHDCSFVPVKVKADGSLYYRGESKKLYTESEFSELGDLLKSQMKTLSQNVFCGKMDISPLELENNKAEPCKYCALADFCRSSKQSEEDDDVEE